MQRLLSYLHQPKLVGGMLFGLALLLYLNTVPNSWAIDDGLVIYSNVSVQQGAGGIPELFTSDYLESSTGQKIRAIAGSRYRPLTQAVFALVATALARPAKDASGKPILNAQGQPLYDLSSHTAFPHLLHLFNALCYALLCLVLYQLLLKLFRNRPHASTIAFTATLLFTVHPLHTEAVANVKGLDEIAALLLALLSLRLLVAAVETPSGKAWWVAGGVGCLLLSLLSKENALAFVVIIPLTLRMFRNVPVARVALLCSPLLLAVGCYLLLRVQAVGSLSLAAPDPVNLMNNPFLVVAGGQAFAPLVPGSEVQVLQHPSVHSIVPMATGERLATISYTWLQYLKLFLVPARLSYDYYPRRIAVYTLGDTVVWGSVLLHLGLLVWALANLRRRPVTAYGILFYFSSFLMVSNLLFPVGTNMAERFLFMPSVGLCITVASILAPLFSKPGIRLIAVGGFGLAVVLLSIRTVVRNMDWQDNLTLIEHDLDGSTGSAKIRSDYGEVIIQRILEDRAAANAQGGELTPAMQAEHVAMLQTTLPLYKEALDVYPMYGLVWFNLARTHQWLGEAERLTPNERLTHLLTAVAAYGVTDTYRPRQYLREVTTMKSSCYAALGKLYGQQFGDLDQALEYLHTARRLNAKNAYAAFLLGTAYDLQGQSDSAYYYTRQAYLEDTANRDYMENYAQVLQQQVGRHWLGMEALVQSGRLLEVVRKQNENVPDADVRKASRRTRTLLLLRQNDSLQKTVAL